MLAHGSNSLVEVLALGLAVALVIDERSEGLAVV